MENTPPYTITVTTALIDAVYHHFLKRLLSGQFEVEEFTDGSMKINIDGYIFNFYVHSYHAFVSQAQDRHNFMNILLSNEQKHSIYKHIEQRYNEYVKRELIAKKERELEALKQSL